MKKTTIFFAVLIFFGVGLALPAFSQDSKSATDHSGHLGVKIHESTIEGYGFAYHLIDIQKGTEEMKDMKGSNEANMTHLVEGPDGAKQKLMAMGMQGAFGANANFKTKGTYTVKTKFLAGDKKLLDKFSYEVK